MSWNYRILAHELEGEIGLQIHEVYYDKDKKPNGYVETPSFINGEGISDIVWNLERMMESKDKPILYFGERFPEEYILK